MIRAQYAYFSNDEVKRNSTCHADLHIRLAQDFTRNAGLVLEKKYIKPKDLQDVRDYIDLVSRAVKTILKIEEDEDIIKVYYILGKKSALYSYTTQCLRFIYNYCNDGNHTDYSLVFRKYKQAKKFKSFNKLSALKRLYLLTFVYPAVTNKAYSIGHYPVTVDPIDEDRPIIFNGRDIKKICPVKFYSFQSYFAQKALKIETKEKDFSRFKTWKYYLDQLNKNIELSNT